MSEEAVLAAGPQGTEQMPLCGNPPGHLHNEGILSCTQAGPSTRMRPALTRPHPPPLPWQHLQLHLSFCLPQTLVLCLGLCTPVSSLALSACDPLPSLLSSAPSLSLAAPI